MPIHDWTRVNAGLFHHFHQCWIVSLCDALNAGRLPAGFFALAEQNTVGLVPAEADPYVAKANRLAIHHSLGDVVAVIEIVSPGNKASRSALRSFAEKAVGLLRQGVHLLIVDLFPPTPRDPHGIHKAIWDEIHEEPFALPPDKPLILASYSAGLVKVAYVEPVAVGDELPEMPLFLEAELYIPSPLESTYQTTWSACPAEFQEAVVAGLPAGDE
jgi:hypothetical protein